MKGATTTLSMSFLLALVVTGICSPSMADAVSKSGPCPVGYLTQGSYCVSQPDSGTVAVPKVGNCPIGYQTQGGYCVATQEDAPKTVIKDGPCPVGFTTQGRYCVDGEE